MQPYNIVIKLFQFLYAKYVLLIAAYYFKTYQLGLTPEGVLLLGGLHKLGHQK